MPIGQYKDWAACKADGKSDNYCGWLEHHAGPDSKEAIYECSCGFIDYKSKAKEHISLSRSDASEGLDVTQHNMIRHDPKPNTKKSTESKTTGMTYQGFIERSMDYYKKKFATESVGMFYGLPQTQGVKKIKGLLAYAGVSLNNRLYLPEELSKGHEMTVPLLLNHSSTAGAEAEVPTLPQKYQDNLYRGIDTQVGEVTLHWDAEKLTLSYEGYTDDPFFINEINQGKMGVSLGMVYDANSPKICNEQCYTVIKGAEFREVSLVYHPGFPIVTIESNEALLKKKATEAIGQEKPHAYLAENPVGSPDEDKECQVCGEPKSSKLHNTPPYPKVKSSLDEANDLDATVTSPDKSPQDDPTQIKEAELTDIVTNSTGANPPTEEDTSQDKSEKLVETTGSDPTAPSINDMNDPFKNKSKEPPKIDENNDEIDTKKDPNINVLNANIHENVNKNHMSQDKKTKANEDAYSMTTAPADPGTVNPSGELPAKGVPYDQCGDGQIWSASQQKCVPADTGSSTARGAPPTVAPVSQPTAESRGNTNSDRRTSHVATQEHLRNEEADEAERALKVAEQRIRAKELYLKEQQLDSQARNVQLAIKRAKEGARPQAITSSTKPTNAPGTQKLDAYESTQISASQWLKQLIADEDVPMSKKWKVDKEALIEPNRLIQTLDDKYQKQYTPFDKFTGESKMKATETVTGPPTTAFMRIMSEQVLVLPGSKVVTPIRQFCETKILPPGTNQAQFYDFGAVTFSAITEDGSTKVSESNPIIRAQQLTVSPIGTLVTIGYTQTETSPVDLIAALNRSYALESVNQEAIAALNTAYNNDTGSSGDATNVKAIGGGSKTGYWVDGHTGSQITSDASGLSTLSFDGLKAGKGVIQDGGFDDSNLICYTSGKAIRDLQDDPNLDTYIGFSKPAIITEGVVERIAGVNLVRTSANAAATQGGTSVRSVLFVPGLAFAIASGRDLTMEAQRRNELQVIYVTGTQRIAAAVKNVEVTCRLSTT